MTGPQRRVSLQTAALGFIVTLLIASLDQFGWLRRVEFLAADCRARLFQQYTPPTDRLIHIDIDDASLDEIGRWPWPRKTMAEIVDEVSRAGPKVIGLDVFFSEVETPRPEQQLDGSWKMTDHDLLLAAAIQRAGNVLVPVHVPLDIPNPASKLGETTIKLLARDLEMSQDQLAMKLRSWGFDESDIAEEVQREYPLAIKAAMFRRVDDAMGMGPASSVKSEESLRDELLPNSAKSHVRSVADQVLHQVFPKVKAIRSLERFTCPIPDDHPPLLAGTDEDATISVLADAARYCGYVDYLPFSDGVVRTVPLWIACRERLIPQAGLSLACAYLGYDIHTVRIEPKQVIIHGPGGQSDIVIPVHSVNSDKRGDLGMFMDIPWVGTDDWKTAYDWPSHQRAAQHLPITKVWEICEIGAKIEANDQEALKDVSVVLPINDVDKFDSLRASWPPFENAAAWNKIMADAFAAISQATKTEYGDQINLDKPLDASGNIDPNDLNYITAIRNLQIRSRLNTELLDQRDHLRQSLADRLHDKAALIGWVASGMTDLYPTPLHAACPGVVIQGMIFNAILTGNLLATLPPSAMGLVTWILGLTMSVIVAWRSPRIAMIATAILIASYLAINWIVLFHAHRIVLGTTTPIMAVISVWSLCSLFKFLDVHNEHSRIMDEFGSQVDENLFKYLLEHPDEDFDPKDREITVVFTDLAGFTALSEKIKSKAVNLLNLYLERMEPIIHANGGLIDKFMGDGIMFFFGAPSVNIVESKTHAMAAVRTVMAMQEAMVNFNTEIKFVLDAERLDGLTMRAGISTGMMLVGKSGPARRSNYTVLGDCVNYGSRLESANKATGTLVLISARTAELVDDFYVVREIGRLQVVGREEAPMVYEPLARKPDDTANKLKRSTAKMVDAYICGPFEECRLAANNLEAEFGRSQKTLCDLYRSNCEKPPEPFRGQIRLEHK